MGIKTINKNTIAAGVLAAFTGFGASAATLKVDANQSVGAEATTVSGGLQIAAGALPEFQLANDVAAQDRLTFTLTNAEFLNNGEFGLIVSTTAASDIPASATRFTSSDASTLTFRFTNGYSTGDEFTLTASNSVTSTVPTYVVEDLASDALVTIDAEVTTSDGITVDEISSAATLFTGSTEFFGDVDTEFDASVSLENGRVNFGGTTTPVVTDTLELEVEKNVTGAAGTVTIDADDMVDITVSGDFSGVSSLTLDSKTFTISGGNATVSVLASDAITSSGTADNVLITATVDGTTELTQRDFTTTLVLNFDDEDNSTLLDGADAGTWSVNALNAVVSAMSLNVSGFSSFINVVNSSDVDASLTAVATWNADGSNGELEDVDLGTASANDITTIGEAAILSALGLSDAEGAVTVSLNISVDAPADSVHVVAEKKGSEGGRLGTPVYYSNTRTLGQ